VHMLPPCRCRHAGAADVVGKSSCGRGAACIIGKAGCCSAGCNRAATAELHLCSRLVVVLLVSQHSKRLQRCRQRGAVL
jgi:hypothetical protein